MNSKIIIFNIVSFFGTGRQSLVTNRRIMILLVIMKEKEAFLAELQMNRHR